MMGECLHNWEPCSQLIPPTRCQCIDWWEQLGAKLTTPTWLDWINIRDGGWVHLVSLGIFGWGTHLDEQAHCSQAGQIEGAGAQVFGLVTTAQHPTDSKHSSYVFVWRFIWLLHVVGLLLFGVPPRGQSTHLPVSLCSLRHFPQPACCRQQTESSESTGKLGGDLENCSALFLEDLANCTAHCTNLATCTLRRHKFAFMSRLDPTAYLVLCHL